MSVGQQAFGFNGWIKRLTYLRYGAWNASPAPCFWTTASWQ
jgi:hypothetical protein